MIKATRFLFCLLLVSVATVAVAQPKCDGILGSLNVLPVFKSALYRALIQLPGPFYKKLYSHKYELLYSEYASIWAKAMREKFPENKFLFRGMGLRKEALASILGNGLNPRFSSPGETIFATLYPREALTYSTGSGFGSGPSKYYVFVMQRRDYWLPGFDRAGPAEGVFVTNSFIPAEDIVGYFVFDPALNKELPFQFVAVGVDRSGT
jgi:hypothetical protein